LQRALTSSHEVFQHRYEIGQLAQQHLHRAALRRAPGLAIATLNFAEASLFLLRATQAQITAIREMYSQK
jgi:hypothetical protein